MATKRKAASALTAAEQTAYQDTIGQLIQTGAYGSMVAIHGDMNHDQHGSMGPVGAERFLSWHRDFLLKMEVQMQTLNPDTGCALAHVAVAEGEPYGPGTQLTSIRVSAAESR